MQLLLLDDETNEILGTVKTLNLNDRLTENEKTARFKLNSGLKNTRKAKLAMLIEGIDETELNLVTEISDDSGSLPKENVNEITLESVNVVQDYDLVQNYPNPFNPVTNITFSLPEKSLVTIKVYDILGREVAELVNNVKEAGTHSVTFDGSAPANGINLASGMYIVNMQAGDFTRCIKILLMK